MNNENTVLKDFQLDKAKNLLDEVHRVFINNNLQIVSINNEEEIKADDLIKLFKIDKVKDPIYLNVKKIEDVDNIIQEISKQISHFKSSISDLLTANENLEHKDVEEALYAILSAISNFDKVFSNKIKRGIDDTLESIDEIREKLASNLRNILNNRFIRNIIGPLYEGIKFRNCEIYRIMIRRINIFLQQLGVYTIVLEYNEKFEYDFIEPQES